MVGRSRSRVIGDRRCGGVVRDGRRDSGGVCYGAGCDWVLLRGSAAYGRGWIGDHGAVREGCRVGRSCR